MQMLSIDVGIFYRCGRDQKSLRYFIQSLNINFSIVQCCYYLLAAIPWKSFPPVANPGPTWSSRNPKSSYIGSEGAIVKLVVDSLLCIRVFHSNLVHLKVAELWKLVNNEEIYQFAGCWYEYFYWLLSSWNLEVIISCIFDIYIYVFSSLNYPIKEGHLNTLFLEHKFKLFLCFCVWNEIYTNLTCLLEVITVV